MLKRVSDPKLSLWQSSVAQAIQDEGEVSQSNILDHSMMKAVNQHVEMQLIQPGLMAAPNPKDTDEEKESIYLSDLYYRMAEAKIAGDEALVEKLTTECREYATCDLFKWAEVVIIYLGYLEGEKKPIYHDWKKLNKDISTYGVVDYKLPNDATVAMIGDWGTGLDDAKALLKDIITKHKPDALLHLGDVYYSGTPEEFKFNMEAVYDNALKETGAARVPFLSIPGNHDYYSFGYGFYPFLKRINKEDSTWEQEASYFCLRTQDNQWQFLGMDTGFQDRNPIPGLMVENPSLEDSEIDWHLDKLKNFDGTTILLSHHQLFSQHSKLSSKKSEWLNQNLLDIFQPYFPKIAAWFWGHEHNFAMYANGLYGLAKGRLVGCSGYEEGSFQEDPYKPHSAEFITNVPIWEDTNPNWKLKETDGYFDHGYAIFKLGHPSTAVTYYSFPSGNINAGDTGTELVSERIEKPNPKPPGDIVKYGEEFKLKHNSGKFIMTRHHRWLGHYYPLLGDEKNSVNLKLWGGENGDLLINNNEVQIETTEKNVRNKKFLGKWLLHTNVYYYTKDQNIEKQSWFVLKKNEGDDPYVRYGDEVYITNKKNNYRLVPSPEGDGVGLYVMTEDEDDINQASYWIIEKPE